MKNLTPQEVLRALADGVRLQYKPRVKDEWNEFDIIHNQVTIRTLFSDVYEFRVYQDTVTIGGISFPKPESEPLSYGTYYWLTEPTYMLCSRATPNVWQNSEYDLRYLRKGLVHLTPQNARLHGEALIKLSGGSAND